MIASPFEKRPKVSMWSMVRGCDGTIEKITLNSFFLSFRRKIRREVANIRRRQTGR